MYRPSPQYVESPEGWDVYLEDSASQWVSGPFPSKEAAETEVRTRYPDATGWTTGAVGNVSDGKQLWFTEIRFADDFPELEGALSDARVLVFRCGTEMRLLPFDGPVDLPESEAQRLFDELQTARRGP
jgi:hypothetical protein